MRRFRSCPGLAAFLLWAAVAGCTGAEAERVPLIGTFAFAHDPGEPGFEVTLAPDGTATSTAAGPGTVTRGTWRVVSGAARIRWADGWRNELSRSGSGWMQRSWPPGQSFSDPPEKTVPARRIDGGRD